MSTSNTIFLWNPHHEPFVTSGDNADLPPASKAMLGCVAPFMIILVLTGIVIALLAVREWISYDALNERGVVTQGEYIDYGSSDVGSRTYNVYYTYVVEDVEHRGSQVVTGVQNAQDRVGQTLDVLYDPEQPSLSRPGTRASTSGRTLMTIGAVIWNIIVVAVVLTLWRVANEPVRLHKAGQLVMGEVLDFAAHEHVSNEQLVSISLRYDFQSPQTQARIEHTHKGLRRREDLDLDAPPQPGDPVAILYANDQKFEVL